jgi:hypothetical protein
MARTGFAIALSVLLVSVVGVAVVLGDLVVHDLLASRLAAPGAQLSIGLEPHVTLLRADHHGRSVLAEPAVAALAAAGLAVAVLALVPLLVRDFTPTGLVAAMGTGLVAGGLFANQRWLVVDGYVLDAVGIRLPGDWTIVGNLADAAALAGVGVVAVLTAWAVLAAVASMLLPAGAAHRAARASTDVSAPAPAGTLGGGVARPSAG